EGEHSEDDPHPDLRDGVRDDVDRSAAVQAEQPDPRVDDDRDRRSDAEARRQNAMMLAAPGEAAPRSAERESELEQDEQADDDREDDSEDHARSLLARGVASHRQVLG